MKLHWVQKPSITIFWWDTGLWFHPIWKICSSNWTSAPNRGENQKNIWNHLVIFRWWIRHQPGIHLTSFKPTDFGRAFRTFWTSLYEGKRPTLHTPESSVAWGVPNRQQWLACWTACKALLKLTQVVCFLEQVLILRNQQKKMTPKKQRWLFCCKESWKLKFERHFMWFMSFGKTFCLKVLFLAKLLSSFLNHCEEKRFRRIKEIGLGWLRSSLHILLSETVGCLGIRFRPWSPVTKPNSLSKLILVKTSISGEVGKVSVLILFFDDGDGLSRREIFVRKPQAFKLWFRAQHWRCLTRVFC